MRLLIASMAALAALAFAAPSFAQEDPSAAPAPAPVPTTKAKPGSAAYCQKLKSATSRSACMKKLTAQATPKATTTKKAKKGTTSTAAKQPDVGQLAPPPATSSPAPAAGPTGGTVAVPPLPQKTI
jgi:hypothetical protein